MDSIDDYLNRLRADTKPLCNPHLERRIANQDAFNEFLQETVHNAGTDISTALWILEDIGDDFLQEFMEAYRLYGSQHLTKDKMAEVLTGMIEAYDAEVRRCAEYEWDKDNG